MLSSSSRLAFFRCVCASGSSISYCSRNMYYYDRSFLARQFSRSLSTLIYYCSTPGSYSTSSSPSFSASPAAFDSWIRCLARQQTQSAFCLMNSANSFLSAGAMGLTPGCEFSISSAACPIAFSLRLVNHSSGRCSPVQSGAQRFALASRFFSLRASTVSGLTLGLTLLMRGKLLPLSKALSISQLRMPQVYCQIDVMLSAAAPLHSGGDSWSDKIASLGNRIQLLSAESVPEAQAPRCQRPCAQLEERVSSLEKQILNSDEVSRNGIQGLRNEGGSLHRYIQALGGEVVSGSKQLGEQLACGLTQLNSEVTRERQSLRDVEMQLMTKIEGFMDRMKQVNAKKIDEVILKQEVSRKILYEEFERLRQQLNREADQRALHTDRLAKGIVRELNGLEQKLASNQRERRETQEGLQKQIGKLSQRLQEAMRHQQQEREEGEELMLRLIERTCERIEANTRRKSS